MQRRTRLRGPAPWPNRGRRTVAAVMALVFVVLLAAGLLYFFILWPRGKAPPRAVPPVSPDALPLRPIAPPR